MEEFVDTMIPFFFFLFLLILIWFDFDSDLRDRIKLYTFPSALISKNPLTLTLLEDDGNDGTLFERALVFFFFAFSFAFAFVFAFS